MDMTAAEGTKAAVVGSVATIVGDCRVRRRKGHCDILVTVVEVGR